MGFWRNKCNVDLEMIHKTLFVENQAGNDPSRRPALGSKSFLQGSIFLHLQKDTFLEISSIYSAKNTSRDAHKTR